MTFIRCPHCGDIIPLLVAACPSCRRCPSCGRKNTFDQERCNCDYPESEIALESLTEYYGLPDSSVEIERQCREIQRRFVRAAILCWVTLSCFLTVVTFVLLLVFGGTGIPAVLALPFVIGIPASVFLVYRRTKLIRKAREHISSRNT